MKQDEDADLEEVEVVEAPLEDLFQIENEPEMAAIDKRVIKLTAQYVAINGQNFLQKLAKRIREEGEQNSAGRFKAPKGQFDFLRPTHPLSNYFGTLVEQYSLILDPPLPPPESKQDLKKSASEKQQIPMAISRMSASQKYIYAFSHQDDKMAYQAILEEGRNRYKYQKYQVEQAKYNEKLRVAGLGGQIGNAQPELEDDGIDWHDFIVVQTIEWDKDADEHED